MTPVKAASWSEGIYLSNLVFFSKQWNPVGSQPLYLAVLFEWVS